MILGCLQGLFEFIILFLIFTSQSLKLFKSEEEPVNEFEVSQEAFINDDENFDTETCKIYMMFCVL